MANILLVYATNSSGTFQAAELIQAELERAKHTVTMQHARDTQPEDLKKYPIVILGSCTFELFVDGQRLEGQLQIHMHALAQALQHMKMPDQRFALFALGDRSYTDFCHAADLLEAVVDDMDGKLLVKTLRIDSWFFEIHANRTRVRDWTEQLNTAIS